MLTFGAKILHNAKYSEYMLGDAQLLPYKKTDRVIDSFVFAKDT